jgi:hypothetical protein
MLRNVFFAVKSCSQSCLMFSYVCNSTNLIDDLTSSNINIDIQTISVQNLLKIPPMELLRTFVLFVAINILLRWSNCLLYSDWL